ncbi:amino acid ABC transporter permease [Phytoactinopolyspora alkaliphila]|uniref:Amino acid ABC transporter permease n=1 Tax=Phytoactinopolyspora alkaliphila TaxID=1783498 RepID=A0A6N9YFR7_9ACTN|nr:amino acid ABC transporter permease [Phytoactinopolyspora alkaliphila]NED93780.1 amino acid ABC transporter permease [Phytoactinopolyspora alkaliphila]
MTSVLYDIPGPKARRRERIGSVIGGLFVLGLLALGAWQLQQNGIFEAERWSVFFDPPKNQEASDVWNFILVEGLGATLRAAAIAAPLAVLLGLILAVGRITPQRWVSWPSILVIELFRGLPVVLMMLFGVLALQLSFLQAVVFGLVVYNMAIFAEIFRAGIVSLPKGQSEAAYAVGLTRTQTLLSILLPQAVRRMLPSLISQLVVLLKDSSLGFIIGYAELLRSVQNLRDFFGIRYVVPLFVVGAAIYIIINLTLSRLAVYIERRGSKKAAGGVARAEEAVGGQVRGIDDASTGRSGGSV